VKLAAWVEGAIRVRPPIPRVAVRRAELNRVFFMGALPFIESDEVSMNLLFI
jgi:hypothetical protein